MEPLPAVRAAIHEILTAITNAVNARDLEATVGLFAPDPDTVLAASEVGGTARSPAELRAFVERFFVEPFTFRWRWDDVRASASGNVAWVFADGDAIRTYGSGDTVVVPYRMTLVLENRDGKWLIQHYHGSSPLPKGSYDKV